MSLLRFAAAVVIYTGFATYLYQPYFRNFHPPQYLFVANACLASLGCFVLSRRWTSGFWASLFGGAVYGFGPFALGLAKFHPTAGSLAAAIPWLFCPAAFCTRSKRRWAGWPLSVLPFLAVALFFQVSVHYRLFAVSTQARLHLGDLASLLAPTVMAERGLTKINLIGFYHVPVAGLVMGLSMFLVARRFGIMAILVIGAVLASFKSFLDISPIMWAAIPVLCCSILLGAGIQGLASAGPTDRKWVLAVAAVMGALSIVTLLLATKYFGVFAGLGKEYARLFVSTAKMYLLGTVAVTILFFMAKAKLQLSWLRLMILCSAMAVDIFFSARFIVDEIF
ncbi:MAG TPA: hypothetical protein VMW16_16415 [Sedimentisphaerales bacterium]|nr:hypothetical protein [Sedimentisphaerales bacterium]